MDNFQGRLMSKNGRLTMFLAKEMLIYKTGDRIKTVEQYSESFSTGRGTVQASMKFLQNVGAITLESRGHMGTFLTYLDYKKLWKITDFGNIMGVMPLPYTKRYEGFATGLYKVFEQADILFNLAFMRGSSKRIEALKSGKYNFAIVSKLAAKIEINRSNNIEVLYEFSPGSFAGEHVLIFRDKNESTIKDGMRVALDPASTDQVILTQYECEGKNVKYIETSYSQILQKLDTNEIDAAIWNGDEVFEKKLDFNVCPLNNPKTKELNSDDIIAAIVINKEKRELGQILRKFIDMAEIERIQHKVINKQMIPVY